MRNFNKAMVVLSGGQDSTTALFWAKSRFDEVHAITFDYGQRHSIEIQAAHNIAKRAGVKSWELLGLHGLMRSRSPLVDLNAELETYESFEQMEQTIGDRVELTFVPMRNALFLTIAANHAVSRDCFDLVTGVCQMDNANYPDCRGDFIYAQELAIKTALGISNFLIHAPLLQLTKAQSVELASDLPGCMEALAYSHTCYAGKFPPCGVCHACVLRAEGFRLAGKDDPLLVRARNESQRSWA